MKTQKEQKKVILNNDALIPKEIKGSSCCGPTCCDNSNKKEINKKDK